MADKAEKIRGRYRCQNAKTGRAAIIYEFHPVITVLYRTKLYAAIPFFSRIAAEKSRRNCRCSYNNMISNTDGVFFRYHPFLNSSFSVCPVKMNAVRIVKGYAKSYANFPSKVIGFYRRSGLSLLRRCQVYRRL